MNLRIVLASLLLLVTVAQAETVRFAPQHEDIVFTARGQDIEISGDHGDILIQGSAGRITISGSHHDVVISEAAELVLEGHHHDVKVSRVGAIYLPGHHHDVVVTDCQPVVSDTGAYNEIVSIMGGSRSAQEAAGASTDGTVIHGVGVDTEEGNRLTLSGAGRQETVNVEGREVVVQGSGNVLTLLGRPARSRSTGP
jgi:hypothetical protein